MKHASIIPLIGGEVLASDEVWQTRPDYLLSYAPFEANESHLRHYYAQQGENIPYFVLDKGDRAPYNVDVISSTCPCAGLSSYHTKAGEDNPNNQWMEKTARYVLGEVKPKVFWGENSPQLVGKVGKFMFDKLREISLSNGYSMSIFLTKNLNHGVSQFRKRSFYFFWKKSEFGEQTPLFQYIQRPHQKIEDVILNSMSNFQMEPINKKTPSKDDPYYRYILEEIFQGISHKEHFDIVKERFDKGNDVESFITSHYGHDYKQVQNWMEKNNYLKEAEKCKRKYEKLANNGNIMRRFTQIPYNYIGAFVGHHPVTLTHPYEDRYITYREAMNIMGLPSDFELLNPEKSSNHICQNVHFQTAQDMALEVQAVMNNNRPYVNTDFLLQNNLNKSYKILNESKSTLTNFL